MREQSARRRNSRKHLRKRELAADRRKLSPSSTNFFQASQLSHTHPRCQIPRMVVAAQPLLASALLALLLAAASAADTKSTSLTISPLARSVLCLLSRAAFCAFPTARALRLPTRCLDLSSSFSCPAAHAGAGLEVFVWVVELVERYIRVGVDLEPGHLFLFVRYKMPCW